MTKRVYLRIQEAADYLRVSIGTLYQYTHSGEIPYRKHGRYLVFLQEELDAWSDSRLLKKKDSRLSPFQLAKQRLLNSSLTLQHTAYSEEKGVG